MFLRGWGSKKEGGAVLPVSTMKMCRRLPLFCSTMIAGGQTGKKVEAFLISKAGEAPASPIILCWRDSK